jgi:ABC-2 type transport system ATP-binding protein
MTETILKTTNLTKAFSGKRAVNSVNMQINRGSIYGFIGKNGAGKTTLMRVVCGLAAATSGHLELFGKSSHADLQRERARIGSMIEMPSLYRNLTAVENLEVQRRILGETNTACINEVLETVGLTDTGKKKVRQFSLGMKQRLGMAVALLGKPEFLILDEPINGMDPVGITEVRETLLSLANDKGITILISSHILTELHHLATHYGIIHDGYLIKQVSAQELDAECSQYIRLVTSDSEKTANVLKSLEIDDFEVKSNNEFRINDDIDPEKITNALSLNRIGIRAIHTVTQDLESYFISLIGGNKV